MNQTNSKPDLYQAVTDQVLELMETHGSDWTKPWTGSGIPQNALTKAEYQGSNILMLGMNSFLKGYETNWWATFKQWKMIGAQVRKGEKSTLGIFFKKLVKEDDDGNEKAIPIIRSFRVFNSAQVEGWEPPAKENQGAAERIDQAETFISNTGAEIKHGSSGAFYVPKDDKISMPEIEAFVGSETSSPTESYYGCLLHELGHWTGAKHRLDRDLSGRFGSEKYAGEELVAEMSAAFLCAHLGISLTPRADHAQYLNSWIQKLKDDKRAFFTAASAAQSAADYLRGLQQDLEEAA